MKIYKVLLFITAATQLISPYITKFSGGSNFNELLITPAKYTFSIWGVITIFSSIYAFWHLFFDKHIFSKRFYIYLSSVYICFTIWLILAEREMLSSTLIVFLFMYAALATIFNEGIKEKTKNLWNTIFLQGGLAMYLGWSSVAVLANLGVYIFSFGLRTTSEIGIILQLLLVFLATLSAAFTLYKTRYNTFVFATHWWAFAGILVGLISRDNTASLTLGTSVCILGLNLFFFIKRASFNREKY